MPEIEVPEKSKARDTGQEIAVLGTARPEIARPRDGETYRSLEMTGARDGPRYGTTKDGTR
jgi:hypothetical protein